MRLAHIGVVYFFGGMFILAKCGDIRDKELKAQRKENYDLETLVEKQASKIAYLEHRVEVLQNENTESATKS